MCVCVCVCVCACLSFSRSLTLSLPLFHSLPMLYIYASFKNSQPYLGIDTSLLMTYLCTSNFYGEMRMLTLRIVASWFV